MKQWMFLWMAFCLCASIAAADRTTYDPTKTRVAMPLPEPPTIDGVIDLAGGESWVWAAGAQPNGDSYWTFTFDDSLEDFTQGADVSSGEGPIWEQDLTAQLWVGYDSENLYVAVRVVDDVLFDDSAAPNSQNESTWLDDSVEVFVDGDNSNFETRDTTGTNPEIVDSGGQYVITINNAYREAEAGNPGFGENAAWYAQTSLNDAEDGYDAEFRISLSDLGNPQPGDIIGFDIAINDDDDGENSENQYIWTGETHVEATYGNLFLGPRSYVAPKTAVAPTIDGTINADEYPGAEEIQITSQTGVYNGNDDWELGDHDWSAWIVHDDEAVYVAIDVTDDVIHADDADPGSEDGSTWTDDSAEIFFDANASDDRGRDTASLYEGQYVFTTNGAWRDNEANNPLFGEQDDWFAASTVTATGYQLEFKVTKQALLDVQDDFTMGFDIAVNDDDEGPRKTQLAWNGRPHNESSYGNLTLSSSSTPIHEWSLY